MSILFYVFVLALACDFCPNMRNISLWCSAGLQRKTLWGGLPAGVWVLAGHNWTPPGSGYSPPCAADEKVGANTSFTHAHSLTDIFFFSILAPRAPDAEVCSQNSRSLPHNMQPHFPFSQHSPPMLASHWSAVKPMAGCLCCFCRFLRGFLSAAKLQVLQITEHIEWECLWGFFFFAVLRPMWPG